MKFALFVVVFALLHGFLSFAVSFSAGISPPGSGWKVASFVLTFPLQLLPNQTPSWMFWPLWGLVSLAWGMGAGFVFRRLL